MIKSDVRMNIFI